MKAISGPRRRKLLPGLPLLENGDHLTQAEFHRRYKEYPEDIKAELIGGIVYMASPLRCAHGFHHSDLGAAFWLYASATPGTDLSDNATTILGDESEPQPDLALLILAGWGGQSIINAEGYVQGSPELPAEATTTTL